ncbi:hypothetical protein ACTMTJ_34670 [Phytohabitans sp. LJ34]|uniref:hypothetical protein n=1 Tax=Phytohabitans sp. LJ34 TaxID=3452217 RepID=UPI003F8900DF
MVMLVGVPVVLVRTVGNPLPRRGDLPGLIQQPLTEQNIYAAIAVAAWLIWAGVLYAAIATIGQAVRRSVTWLRRLPRLPLPTPLQGLAGGMLGAVAVTATPTSAPATPPATAASNVDNAGRVWAPVVDGERQAGVSGGVELADGGWLPAPLAQSVQAAAAAVWWRRRRHYDPTLPAHRAGEDLNPLPRTAHAVQAALADTPPATDTYLPAAWSTTYPPAGSD